MVMWPQLRLLKCPLGFRNRPGFCGLCAEIYLQEGKYSWSLMFMHVCSYGNQPRWLTLNHNMNQSFGSVSVLHMCRVFTLCNLNKECCGAQFSCPNMPESYSLRCFHSAIMVVQWKITLKRFILLKVLVKLEMK